MTALHRFNQEFTWSPGPGPGAAQFLSPDQITRFDRDGYCLVTDAFDPDTIAELAAAIDPWEAGDEAFVRDQPNGELFIAKADAITFTVHLVARSETCRTFVSHPSLLGIVGDLVGPAARLYWDQAVYKKPEKVREFPWHQDNGYAFVEPQQYLTCWVPLTDATVDNGCPWVAPGRHRLGTLRHEMSPYGLTCFEINGGAAGDGGEGGAGGDVGAGAIEAVPVEAPVGSVVVFSSLTPHRTGPNVTDEVRKAYIVQYAPDGAAVRRSDDRADDVPADDPARQFVVGGRQS